MVKKRLFALLSVGILVLLGITGCASTTPETEVSEPAATEAPASTATEMKAEEKKLDISMYEREGFSVVMEDGRLWVFHKDSEDYKKFLETGEPAKQVVRPGAGPGGITLKSTENDTINEYRYTLPGFFVRMEDGRLWVFKTASPDLEAFLKTGEPAKQVIMPGAGPEGVTVKAVDVETINEYMTAYQAQK
jgi:hypothetical protein